VIAVRCHRPVVDPARAANWRVLLCSVCPAIPAANRVNDPKSRESLFVAQYQAKPAEPLRPATDDMMIMEPPPARRIAGTEYFADRNTPSRLTAVCRRLRCRSRRLLPGPAARRGRLRSPSRLHARAWPHRLRRSQMRRPLRWQPYPAPDPYVLHRSSAPHIECVRLAVVADRR
jgi:hypothetical protein